MGLREEREHLLAARRASSSECCSSEEVSSSRCFPRGFDKRHRRKDMAKRQKPKHQNLPLCSILFTNMGSSSYIRRSALARGSFRMDWLPHATVTINNVKHLLCGAISAVFSKTTTAPLERVKMEMQVKRCSDAMAVAQRIYHEGGYSSFWRGNLMNLIRVTPHKAVNFYSFYLYRTALSKTVSAAKINLGGLDRFLAGAMAVLSTAASGAIFYGVYDILKTQYISSERLSRQCQSVSSDEVVMGAGRTMLYGALAGAAAESILYPLEVLRRRMQLQGMEATTILNNARHAEHASLAAATEGSFLKSAAAKAAAKAGATSNRQTQLAAAAVLRENNLSKAIHAAADIFKVDGLPGFYNGIGPHILQVLPSAALSYYFYEACKQALNVEEEE